MIRKKGFTLIELLVVISIIGILAGLALVSFQGARKTARDGKRKADLEQIRSALEMYRADNGSYVTETNCDSSIGSCGGCPCSGSDWEGSIASELESDYIQDLPKDPINNSTYYYYYEPNCQFQGNCDTASWSECCEYYLRAKLETTGQWYYVYNP